MSTAELKLKMFRLIDSLDSHKINELYGVVMNFFIARNEEEGWESLSKKEQKDIEDAILELDSGQGIKHEDVISKYRNKYSDA